MSLLFTLAKHLATLTSRVSFVCVGGGREREEPLVELLTTPTYVGTLCYYTTLDYR